MEDLRTIKTTLAIENAFMELIELKGFSKVKITDIAKRAMVNRNTIYLHYSSKEEIVISILNRSLAMDDFEEKLLHSIFYHSDRKYIEGFINKLVGYVDKNAELYRIVMTDINLNGYMRFYINKIKSKILDQLKNSVNNKIRLDYMISGISGVLTRWVVYANGTKEDIAKELTNICYQEIIMLEKK